ncbi:MAG: hypothetical protein ACR2J6_01095 [Thermoleophilaceae bacterium]
MSVLCSLRKLLLGETWTIPLGVAAAFAVALLARDGLTPGTWTHLGGFILAAAIVATLLLALRTGRSRL